MPNNELARASGGLLRVALPILVLATLAAGIAGGLVRAGVGLSSAGPSWLGPAAVNHAFLMVCVFMGTAIAIERAVAVKRAWAFAGPLASALSGVLVLFGFASTASWLVAGASLAFMLVNWRIVHRQLAAHTVLLLIAAAAWAFGNVLYASGAVPDAVIPWWFAFLVLTIAAERLEMTRVTRHRGGVAPALYVVLGALLLGAAVTFVANALGGVLYGLSLVALAVWLFTFDVARRTVRAQGLSRYMALCLLAGYFWLFLSGAAWAATAVGLPFRDAALHGLALGFVFSMMLGHAPVILPAVARVKLRFGWAFYIPMALLHGSLMLRLFCAPFHAMALSRGAMGNALAIGAFAATVGGAAIAWRIQHRSSHMKHHHGTTAEH